VAYLANATISELTDYRVAMQNQKWKQAMEEEYGSLMKNDTWELTPWKQGVNVVDCKWVFKLKRKADGSIERYKVRLVAKGFRQRYGYDYEETFTPVIKPATIRLILSLVVTQGWSLRQLDIQNAFLHSQLKENVFMKQPLGFEDPGQPNHLCKLKKALYGLKLVPRVGYSRMSEKLQEWGFRASRADTSLFIYRIENTTIYMLVYVDDIIIAISCKKVTSVLIDQLHEKFVVKDLGDLHYFLGIEVVINSKELVLTQRKYTADLLKKANMLNCKGIIIPISALEKLFKTIGILLNVEEATRYISTVGGLQYLTITRPDILFVVNKVYQFMQAPTTSHLVAVRIIRYLKSTMMYGL
jgi:hypothetical protein